MRMAVDRGHCRKIKQPHGKIENMNAQVDQRADVSKLPIAEPAAARDTCFTPPRRIHMIDAAKSSTLYHATNPLHVGPITVIIRDHQLAIIASRGLKHLICLYDGWSHRFFAQ